MKHEQYMTSRYNIFHALAVTLVMGATVSRNFWHNFIHGGFTTPPPIPMLLTAVGCQVGLMLTLLLILWASTLFTRKHEDAATETKYAPLKAIRLGCVSFIPIALGAFALEAVSVLLMEKVFGLPVHGQDLVQWLKPETYPLTVRLILIFVAIISAPILEEVLFRGVLFRGLTQTIPAWPAMLLSGFVFAIIHVNAATLVPLWGLGVAFAWLYWRSKSILAPITAHFLFNLTNLTLVLSGVAS